MSLDEDDFTIIKIKIYLIWQLPIRISPMWKVWIFSEPVEKGSGWRFLCSFTTCDYSKCATSALL